VKVRSQCLHGKMSFVWGLGVRVDIDEGISDGDGAAVPINFCGNGFL